MSFPPHARGWTLNDNNNPAALDVSPARAGMDRSSVGRAKWGRSFPRTRGDGPAPGRGYAGDDRFPPHARGWTCTTGDPQGRGSVSPARAGMDPWPPRSAGCPHSFPRTRGDGPGRRAARATPNSFPPHARGWTPRAANRTTGFAVSPARAGMDPSGLTQLTSGSRFPRTRGDGPKAARASGLTVEFPPHARGWTQRRRCADRGKQVSPARAGMDRVGVVATSAPRGFPRTRGDGPLEDGDRWIFKAFPPHARGWTRLLAASQGGDHVSPARAGMDRHRLRWRLRPAGFPRTRGDGPSRGCPRRWIWRFPPHARGWTSSHQRLVGS